MAHFSTSFFAWSNLICGKKCMFNLFKTCVDSFFPLKTKWKHVEPSEHGCSHASELFNTKSRFCMWEEHILHLTWSQFTFAKCFPVFDIKWVGFNNKQAGTRLDTKEWLVECGLCWPHPVPPKWWMLLACSTQLQCISQSHLNLRSPEKKGKKGIN